MKKFLVLLLSAMMMFAFVACEPDTPAVPELRTEEVTTLDDLEKALANDEIGTIVLKESITTGKSIEITRNVTINLNGVTVTSSNDGFVVSSGASVVFTGNGIVKADGIAVSAIKDGEVKIEDGTYEGEFCVAAGEFDSTAKEFSNGVVTIENGSFTSSEFTLPVWGASKLTVNDGDFTATGNAVVASNGSAELRDAPYDITINGGTFINDIATTWNDKDWISCGIYMANSGKVVLNGGTFNITNGVGVLVRSGDLVANEVTVNLQEKEDKPKAGCVGDSSIVVNGNAEIVIDTEAGYPGTNPTVDNKTAYKTKTITGEEYNPQ